MPPISWTPQFTHQPPQTHLAELSYPSPEIVLVTLNRPKQLNCINSAGHEELDAIWRWLDSEPSLRVGIVTGSGRAFCAGADLKGMHALHYPRYQPLSRSLLMSLRMGRRKHRRQATPSTRLWFWRSLPPFGPEARHRCRKWPRVRRRVRDDHQLRHCNSLSRRKFRTA